MENEALKRHVAGNDGHQARNGDDEADDHGDLRKIESIVRIDIFRIGGLELAAAQKCHEANEEARRAQQGAAGNQADDAGRKADDGEVAALIRG